MQQPAVGLDRDDVPDICDVTVGMTRCELCDEDFYEIDSFNIEHITGFRWGRKCPRNGCTYNMCYSCIIRLPTKNKDMTCPYCRHPLAESCKIPQDLLEWRDVRDSQLQELQDSYDAVYAESRHIIEAHRNLQLQTLRHVFAAPPPETAEPADPVPDDGVIEVQEIEITPQLQTALRDYFEDLLLSDTDSGSDASFSEDDASDADATQQPQVEPSEDN